MIVGGADLIGHRCLNGQFEVAMTSTCPVKGRTRGNIQTYQIAGFWVNVTVHISQNANLSANIAVIVYVIHNFPTKRISDRTIHATEVHDLHMTPASLL
jgi:hypothetical protein